MDREFESCRLLADFLACQLVDLGPDKHFEAVLHDLDGPRTDRTPWAYALVIGAWVYLLPAPLIFYDQRGRLHREDGPAVSWPGDLAWWYWHGVQVPRRLIEDPESITLQEILQEPNAERRRILIERRGLAWFLDRAGATVIDRDEDAGGERRLMQFNLPGEREPLMALVVRCPSTGRVYALRVPPQCGTCREAVAWTFNFPPESYRPAVET